MIWYDMVWCGIYVAVCPDVIKYDMVWYDIV